MPNTFHNSLKFGEAYERIMNEMYAPMYARTELPPPDVPFKPWDRRYIEMLTDEEGNEYEDATTFECKVDTITIRTKNIAIEYQCSGVDSGINATEADVWVYFVHSPEDLAIDYYTIPTPVIREMIEAKQYHREAPGGDNNNAMMYLFRQDLFAEYKGRIVKKSISKANRAIMYEVYDPKKPMEKIYLNIRYEEVQKREHAKTLGARFDWEAKKWYSSPINPHLKELQRLYGK